MTAIGQIHIFADRLREATRPAHHALDHHPLLTPLTHSPLSERNYTHALAALHGPQKAIEKVLSGFAPEIEFPPRLAELDSDLNALGVTPFQLMAELPRFDSVDQMIGAMYVIEGSNLGGAVIARLLEESLPAGTPRVFFANSGGKPRWQKFWRFSTSFCREESFTTVVDAACRTFNLYKIHLDRCQLIAETSQTSS
jgi:heme oxygenase